MAISLGSMYLWAQVYIMLLQLGHLPCYQTRQNILSITISDSLAQSQSKPKTPLVVVPKLKYQYKNKTYLF